MFCFISSISYLSKACKINHNSTFFTENLIGAEGFSFQYDVKSSYIYYIINILYYILNIYREVFKIAIHFNHMPPLVSIFNVFPLNAIFVHILWYTINEFLIGISSLPTFVILRWQCHINIFYSIISTTMDCTSIMHYFPLFTNNPPLLITSLLWCIFNAHIGALSSIRLSIIVL